nr:abscisic acid receptor PYL4-like [Ipomoea batatas]GMD02127.1 abscisic acid receptor PYL4-like [Ipomoea batatas]GME20014.1 abscisic acid receptor PYL4-like [Ipomoea batatas]
MPTTVHCHISDSHHHLSAAVAATTTAVRIQKQPPLPTWTVVVPDSLLQYHVHAVGPNQCCSAVVQEVSAPLDAVWALVRRFDNPQAYKHFLKSCHVIVGDGSSVGTLREVRVVSGVPAVSSTERLDILDDERHTVVVESFVVDVPPGNTKEETCVFVDTIVRCNLQSLAQIAESSGKNNQNIVKSSCN